MSRINQANKNRMYELAVEIIDHKRERPSDYVGACKLYDQTDEEFCAERVKSLLDELNETQAENQRMRSLLSQSRMALDDLLAGKPMMTGLVCGTTTLGNLKASLYPYRKGETDGPTA